MGLHGHLHSMTDVIGCAFLFDFAFIKIILRQLGIDIPESFIERFGRNVAVPAIFVFHMRFYKLPAQLHQPSK